MIVMPNAMFSPEFEELIAKEIVAGALELAKSIAEAQARPKLMKQKEFMEYLKIGETYLKKLKLKGLTEHRLEEKDANIFYSVEEFYEIILKH
jgi:hypothetical protein